MKANSSRLYFYSSAKFVEFCVAADCASIITTCQLFASVTLFERAAELEDAFTSSRL